MSFFILLIVLLIITITRIFFNQNKFLHFDSLSSKINCIRKKIQLNFQFNTTKNSTKLIQELLNKPYKKETSRSNYYHLKRKVLEITNGSIQNYERYNIKLENSFEKAIKTSTKTNGHKSKLRHFHTNLRTISLHIKLLQTGIPSRQTTFKVFNN